MLAWLNRVRKSFKNRMADMLAKSGGHGFDEASQGEWRSGKVLPPMESRSRMSDREPRTTRNFSGDLSGRPERRDIALPSVESGVEKWERRGPLPPLETSDRRPRTGPASRSTSTNFGNAPSRSPSRESPADTAEWRSSKPLQATARSDGSIFPCILNVDVKDTPPPASPSLSGSPVMQRRKLALLPRSEHPLESTSTPLTAEDAKPKSNPFGTAKPVDTDTALKKVEEKLAKEKEHKEELASVKGSAASNPPTSPTAPRHDKPRSNPKQLLRRPSANPSSPATGAGQSEIDHVVAAKAEAQDETTSEGTGKWRKSDNPPIPAASSQEDEAGWETVPSRSKKVNGVGARH